MKYYLELQCILYFLQNHSPTYHIQCHCITVIANKQILKTGSPKVTNRILPDTLSHVLAYNSVAHSSDFPGKYSKGGQKVYILT